MIEARNGDALVFNGIAGEKLKTEAFITEKQWQESHLHC